MSTLTSNDVVGLYCRISKDKTGRMESVSAQERWGREYAARTWPGAKIIVFRDNSITAADDSVREGYDELRAAIAARTITQLWAVEQSRLERRVRGEFSWFELAFLLNRAGITELHTQRGGVVQVTGVAAKIKAVIDADEVERLKARLNDMLDEYAAAGHARGGNVFGYRTAKRDDVPTLIIEEAEAEAIRWGAEMFLDGWSASSIGKEWQKRGFVGRRGAPFSITTVRRVLTGPTIAGLRQHRGVIIGDGNWEPIISKETRTLILAKVATTRTVRTAPDRPDAKRPRPSRGTYTMTPATLSRGAKRKYVLTGLAACGVCGAPMTGTMRTDKGKRQAYMVCARNRGGRSCVTILAVPAEEYVANRLFEMLDTPAFRTALGVDDDHGPRREELCRALEIVEQDRAEYAAMLGSGEMRPAEWRIAKAGLEQREAALHLELDSLPAPRRQPPNVDELRAAWPNYTLDEKAAELHQYIERVTVGRAQVGLPRFDPDRITIEGPGWEE